MTNDRQEPGGRSDPDGWGTNPWIIVDDTAADTGPAPETAPGTPAGGAAPEPPQAAPAADGWDSFGQAETWNGIPVAPPRSRAAAPPRSAAPPRNDSWDFSGAPKAPSAPGAAQEPQGSAWNTPGAGAPGWGAPTAGGPQAPPSGPPQNEWSFEDVPVDAGFPDDDDYDDYDVQAPAGQRRSGRMPRLAFGAASVTLIVACLSVLLVVASAVWHPQAP